MYIYIYIYIYITAGYYDNTTFHRNIKGFMIQARVRAH